MAVSFRKESRTIRGKKYNVGDPFKCYEANGGATTSEGSGSASALKKDTTYYYLGYAWDEDNNKLASYPYAVGTTATSSVRGWYRENVFPYATYTITYNANGGSGAPYSHTKTHGTDTNISTATPTRAGYTFGGWALTKTDADNGTWYYKAGSTCGANSNLTLYAVWTSNSYTITYNANGGSGAPASDTKAHGASATISATMPTRNGYIFKGWSSSANSSTVIYSPGDKYTANASITLFAVWVAAETPEITNLTVERCDSEKNATDEGTSALVSFDWSCAAAVSSIVIKWGVVGSEDMYYISVAASGTNGSVSDEKIGATYQLDLETSYTIKVEIMDSNGGFSKATRTLGESAYPMEFIENNKGIYFGKAVQGHAVGLADLVILPDSSNFNNLTKPGGWAVPSNASAATMENIPIQQAGRVFVATSNGYDDPSSEFKYYIQTYIPYLVTYPIFERHVRKTSATTWIYSPWVVIKRNRASAITAWTGSAITKETIENTQIPLTGYTVVGDGLTISNNAIVIGQYITAVEISAQGMINCASGSNAAAKNLIIHHNGSEVAVSMNGSWSTTKANFELNISPKIIKVNEGDLITFRWYATANDVLSNAAARTYITVKEF